MTQPRTKADCWGPGYLENLRRKQEARRVVSTPPTPGAPPDTLSIKWQMRSDLCARLWNSLAYYPKVPVRVDDLCALGVHAAQLDSDDYQRLASHVAYIDRSLLDRLLTVLSE